MNKIFSKAFLRSLFLKQNGYHKHGVFVHTLKVIFHLTVAKQWKMIPAAILHDIGKPFTAKQDKPEDVANDEYSFKNHEEISYQLIKNWWFISDYTKQLVRYHYLIRDINKSKERDEKRYKRLVKIWDKLSPEFISDLQIFLDADDKGKK
jgi:hypothetical protein